MSSRPSPGRNVVAWALPAALLVAVLLRAEYLRELFATPFRDSLLLDAEWYDQVARRILAGEPLAPDRPFFRPPGYPFFLAAAYRLFDGSLLAPRIVQALLGVLQVVLVARIARRTHGERVAAIAAFLAATYGMFIYFEAEILTTAVGTFLTTLAPLLLIEADARRSTLLYGLGGLAIGIAAITHGSAVTLAAPAVLWALFGGERRWPARLLAVVAVTVGVLVPVGGVTARNVRTSGELVLIGSQGGINFYVGNNPEADGKSALAPGVAEADQVLRGGDYRDGVEIAGETLAERDLGRELTAGEIDRYWYAKARGWMRDQPRDALVLFARKAVYFFSGYEISNNRDLRDQARRYTPILRSFLAQLSLVMPFALLGLFRHGDERGRGPGGSEGAPPDPAAESKFRSRRRARRLLYGMIAMHAATLVAFFVCARYRQPAVAWLIPFGAAGLVAVANDMRRVRAFPRRLARTGIILVLLFAFTNGPFVTRLGLADVTSDRDAPFHRFNLAVLYEREGDLDRAIDEYRAAADTGIPDPRIWLNLGNCLARTGRGAEARDAYRKVLRIAPDFGPSVRANLGVLASTERDWPEAIRQFEECLAHDPRNPQALAGLGAARLAAGHLDEAIVAFRRALDVGGSPEIPLRRSLAVAYLETGLPEEAERECLAALRRAPDDVGSVLVLGRIRVRQGRRSEADALWEKARRLAPGSPAVERAIAEAVAGSP